METGNAQDRGRELRARALGVGVAIAAMAAASWSIGWPAPGISIACGLGVYWLARSR